MALCCRCSLALHCWHSAVNSFMPLWMYQILTTEVCEARQAVALAECGRLLLDQNTACRLNSTA